MWMTLQAEYELAQARDARERRPPRKTVPLKSMDEVLELPEGARWP